MLYQPKPRTAAVIARIATGSASCRGDYCQRAFSVSDGVVIGIKSVAAAGSTGDDVVGTSIGFCSSAWAGQFHLINAFAIDQITANHEACAAIELQGFALGFASICSSNG